MGAAQHDAGENLVQAEAAEGGGQQSQVLLALGVAPEGVVGLIGKLEQDGAAVEQQQVQPEALVGAHLGVGQQPDGEQIEPHRQKEQHRVAEEEDMFPVTVHKQNKFLCIREKFHKTHTNGHTHSSVHYRIICPGFQLEKPCDFCIFREAPTDFSRLKTAKTAPLIRCGKEAGSRPADSKKEDLPEGRPSH